MRASIKEPTGPTANTCSMKSGRSLPAAARKRKRHQLNDFYHAPLLGTRIQFTTAVIDNLIFLAIATVWLRQRGPAEAKLSLYLGGSDLGGGASKEGRRFVNSSILLRK